MQPFCYAGFRWSRGSIGLGLCFVIEHRLKLAMRSQIPTQILRTLANVGRAESTSSPRQSLFEGRCLFARQFVQSAVYLLDEMVDLTGLGGFAKVIHRTDQFGPGFPTFAVHRLRQDALGVAVGIIEGGLNEIRPTVAILEYLFDLALFEKGADVFVDLRAYPSLDGCVHREVVQRTRVEPGQDVVRSSLTIAGGGDLLAHQGRCDPRLDGVCDLFDVVFVVNEATERETDGVHRSVDAHPSFRLLGFL